MLAHRMSGCRPTAPPAPDPDRGARRPGRQRRDRRTNQQRTPGRHSCLHRADVPSWRDCDPIGLGRGDHRLRACDRDEKAHPAGDLARHDACRRRDDPDRRPIDRGTNPHHADGPDPTPDHHDTNHPADPIPDLPGWNLHDADRSNRHDRHRAGPGTTRQHPADRGRTPSHPGTHSHHADDPDPTPNHPGTNPHHEGDPDPTADHHGTSRQGDPDPTAGHHGTNPHHVNRSSRLDRHRAGLDTCPDHADDLAPSLIRPDRNRPRAGRPSRAGHRPGGHGPDPWREDGRRAAGRRGRDR